MKTTQVKRNPQAEEIAIWENANLIAVKLYKAYEKTNEIQDLITEIRNVELYYTTKQEKSLCDRIDRQSLLALRKIVSLSNTLMNMERVYCRVWDMQRDHHDKHNKD